MAITGPDGLAHRILRNTSTADLYELLAAALTELRTREGAAEDPSDAPFDLGLDPASLDLDQVRILAKFGEVVWDAEHERFTACFHSEANASVASEETRAPERGSSWPPEHSPCGDPDCICDTPA